MKRALTILAAVFLAFPVWAQEPVITDEQEAIAREIGRSLRCVVCQNQSIEDSDGDLAKDMRKEVRERLAAGDEPDEAIEFIRARYGDYVLLKPPVQRNTWLALGAALCVADWRRNLSGSPTTGLRSP